MKREELMKQLMEYPVQLEARLKTYHQFKRRAEQLETELVEHLPAESPFSRSKPDDEYKRIEAELTEVKNHLDSAEEAIAVLQARFDANKVIARSNFYID